jgi:hypothetical protein
MNIPSSYVGAIAGLAVGMGSGQRRKRFVDHSTHIPKSEMKNRKNKRKSVKNARKNNRKK